MNICCSNKVDYQVLSGLQQNSMRSILKDTESHIDKTITPCGDVLSFSIEGKLDQKIQKNNLSFTVTKNEILRQITITKKNNKAVIAKVLQPNKSQHIHEGSKLKLGSNVVEIYQIYPLEEHSRSPQALSPLNQKFNESQEEKIRCRICFMEHQTNTDPLLNFCKCSGSVKYMHLQCYRQWFIKKVKIYPGDKITHFQYSNIKCDICREIMPFSVEKNGFKYPLVDYKREFKNQLMNSGDSSAIIFEDLSEISNGNGRRGQIFQSEISSVQSKEGICVVLKLSTTSYNYVPVEEVVVVKMFPDQLYTIGTDSTSKIYTNSRNISPQHAVLYLKDGEVYIEDLYSEYGTFLILEKKRQNTFKSKDGLLLEHSNGQLLSIQQKKSLFSVFDPNVDYTLKLEEKNE